MSVADFLKNTFAKKNGEADPSVTQDLSLAMADGAGTAGGDAGSTIEPLDADSIDSIDALNEADQAELLTVPFLGRRTTVAHQRILFMLLSLALVVLAAVAIFAITQADKVAQQVAGTGQSLMQSQRLAKSVSQALIGSPQAFPDVKESADVLART
ncbi:MAG: methyl-accepting chemotaxis protein, partial [Comamonadaceae bacterium]